MLWCILHGQNVPSLAYTFSSLPNAWASVQVDLAPDKMLALIATNGSNAASSAGRNSLSFPLLLVWLLVFWLEKPQLEPLGHLCQSLAPESAQLSRHDGNLACLRPATKFRHVSAVKKYFERWNNLGKTTRPQCLGWYLVRLVVQEYHVRKPTIPCPMPYENTWYSIATCNNQ